MFRVFEKQTYVKMRVYVVVFCPISSGFFFLNCAGSCGVCEAAASAISLQDAIGVCFYGVVRRKSAVAFCTLIESLLNRFSIFFLADP